MPSDIKLDSGFAGFYKWCKSQSIPVVIVSRYVAMLTYTYLETEKSIVGWPL